MFNVFIGKYSCLPNTDVIASDDQISVLPNGLSGLFIPLYYRSIHNIMPQSTNNQKTVEKTYQETYQDCMEQVLTNKACTFMVLFKANSDNKMFLKLLLL